MLQSWRSAWQAMANFSVPMGTVFRQTGNVMATLIVMIDQMKPGVVSYFPTECTDYIGTIIPTGWNNCGAFTLLLTVCIKCVFSLFPQSELKHAWNCSKVHFQCKKFVYDAGFLHGSLRPRSRPEETAPHTAYQCFWNTTHSHFFKNLVPVSYSSSILQLYCAVYYYYYYSTTNILCPPPPELCPGLPGWAGTRKVKSGR